MVGPPGSVYMQAMRILTTMIFSCALLGACSDDAAPAGGGGEGAGSARPLAEDRGRPSGPPERVTFATDDGVTIVGTLRPGGDARAPAVVLVHQLGSARAEWEPIVEALSRPPGLTTLAIDMRGHGESTAGSAGALAHGEFDRQAWMDTRKDVLAAVAFLGNREDLHPRRIGAAGSSIGSSAVLAAAAEERRIAAVVAISPGRAYHGFDAITPVSRLRDRPLLAIAAEEELPAAEAARDVARIAGHGEIQLYPGSAHGLAIREGSPEITERIDGFLRQALGADTVGPRSSEP